MTRPRKPSCCSLCTSWDSMALMPVGSMNHGDNNLAPRSMGRTSMPTACDARCLKRAKSEVQSGAPRRAALGGWRSLLNELAPFKVFGPPATQKWACGWREESESSKEFQPAVIQRRKMMTNLISTANFNENARLLVRSSAKAVIHAPVDKIDIPEWLFALTDEEYQRCSVAHIAAGATRTPDSSKRIEINVEKVGPGLMVQHWTEDIAEKQHCRLVSLSDMFVQQERTKMQLTWDTSVDHCLRTVVNSRTLSLCSRPMNTWHS